MHGVGAGGVSVHVLKGCKIELGLAKSLMSCSSTEWILQYLATYMIISEIFWNGILTKGKKRPLSFQQIVLWQLKSPQTNNTNIPWVLYTSFHHFISKHFTKEVRIKGSFITYLVLWLHSLKRIAFFLPVHSSFLLILSN